MGWFGRFNNWIANRKDTLGAWSSIVTLVSFPLIVVGLFIGYYQIRDILTLPDTELVFVHPSSVDYEIINRSGKLAEDVLVSFGIFDLDSSSQQPLAIPAVSFNYVNPRSKKGPFTFFGKFAFKDHRYFGIVYVGCRRGERLRTYWIYAKHGDMEESFYAERNSADTFQINISQLRNDAKTYLDAVVPLERRRRIE